MPPRIAVVGWGSLLWEGGAKFDRWHDEWRPDGPIFNLEFCRISDSRLGALTLVIDNAFGVPTTVAWCLSKRRDPLDAVADLRCREGCSFRYIACLNLAVEGPLPKELCDVVDWGRRFNLDFIVWTALSGNFQHRLRQRFTIANALAYIQQLDPAAKAKAAEYLWRAPAFVRTPLRAALQQAPWFGERDRDGAVVL